MKRRLSRQIFFVLFLSLLMTQWVIAADTIILNPGFESGASSWSEYSSGEFNIILNDAGVGANGSNWYAYLGGYDNADEYIYQDITIPAAATSATLIFAYNISTEEVEQGNYDLLTIEVADPPASTTKTTIAYLSNLHATSGWAESASLDLSAYKGKTVRLYFHAVTDLSNPTMFALDDISLTVTIPPSAAVIGDCDNNGNVSIAEVQSAINMFLGLNPVKECVDKDKSTNVSIAEVQSVINAFLGIGLPIQATVPVLLNKTQPEAQALIAAAGLSLGTITQTGSNIVPAGSVSSQNPAGGAAVAKGTAVNLVISSGNILPSGFLATTPIGSTDGGKTVTLATASAAITTAVVESGETLVSSGVTIQVTGEEAVTGNGTNRLVFSVTSPEAAANPEKVLLKVRLTTGLVLPVYGVYDSAAKTFTAELPGLVNGWTMAVIVKPSVQVLKTTATRSLGKTVYGWLTPPEWETFDWTPVFDPNEVLQVDVENRYLPALITAAQTLAGKGLRSPKLWIDTRTNPKARIVHIKTMPNGSHFAPEPTLAEEDPAFTEAGKNEDEMLALGQMYIDPTQLADLNRQYGISLDNIAIHELSHACQAGYDIRRTAASVKGYYDGMATTLGQTYQINDKCIAGPKVFVRTLRDGEYAFLHWGVASPKPSFYRQQDFFAYVTKRYAGGDFAWTHTLLERMGLDTTGKFNLSTEQYLDIYRTALDTALQSRFGKGVARIYREYALDRAYEHSETAILRTTETAQEGFAPNTLAKKLFLATPADKSGLKLMSVYAPVQTETFPDLPSLSTGAVKLGLPVFIPPADQPDAVPPPFSFSVKLEGGDLTPARDESVKVVIFYEDDKETMLPGGMLEVADISGQITVPGKKGASFLTILIMNCNVLPTAVKATITLGPFIESINPNPATIGSNVTIYGSGFGATQGSSKVTIGNTEFTEIVSWSSDVIVFKLVDSAVSGKMKVTVNGVTSNDVDISVGRLLGNWEMVLAITYDNEPGCTSMPYYWDFLHITGEPIPVSVADNGAVTFSHAFTNSWGDITVSGTGTYLVDAENYNRPTLRISGSWTASRTEDYYQGVEIITQKDSGTFTGAGHFDTILGYWWGDKVTASYSSSVRYQWFDKQTPSNNKDEKTTCSATIKNFLTDIEDFRKK